MSNKIYLTPDQIDSVSCIRDEQETNINWLRDDKNLILCSSDNTFITKMKHIMEKDPDSYKCFNYTDNIDINNGKYYSYFFEIPKKLLSFRAMREKKVLSDEQRKLIADRMRSGLHNKKNTLNE